MDFAKLPNFKDVIDVVSWEKIQNTLSESINHSICTIDLDGNDILTSGQLPFYSQMINSTDQGKDLKKSSQINALKKLANNDDYILLYYSDDGLLNIWAQVKVDNAIVGAIGCVSLFDPNKRQVNLLELSKKIGLEQGELDDPFIQLKPVTQEEIKIFGSMLYIISKALPDLLAEKQKDKKKMDELTLVYKIIKAINSTLDLEKILTSVIKFLIEYLTINNCSIILLDNNAGKSSYYYKKPSGIEKVEDIIIHEAKNTKNMVRVADFGSDFRFNKLDECHLTDSLLSVPLIAKDRLIGLVNLYHGKACLQDSDMEFITVICDQISSAILNAKAFENVKESSEIDKLTNLYNRRYFIDKLKDEIIGKISKERPLSVALLDIDDFKMYNDTNGHPKGDRLLKEVSDILKSGVRGIDIVGRYGGEEFIIIFPELNNEVALNIMEQIKKKIQDTDFFGESSQPGGDVTISTGLVTCLDRTITYDSLMDFVDKTLYKSKIRGKNVVTSMIVVNKNLPPIEVQEVNDAYASKKDVKDDCY